MAPRLLTHAFRETILPMYEFLFPPVCFACGGDMARSMGRICSDCQQAMTRPRSEDMDMQIALGRLRETARVSDLIVLYRFEKEGPLQHLLHQLKYGGARAIGEELGRDLGSEILLREGSSRTPVLVPIPLHHAKRRERGYNQAACICRGIARVTGWTVRSDAVRRIRYTGTQTKLDIEARRRNVEDVFEVGRRGKEIVRDREVFLVDDVLTTGATLGSCASALLKAGAGGVTACAVGLAD